MLLLIDNFDSFTYNLVQYFGQLGEEILVRRNNAITVCEAQALCPSSIVISPGPGNPSQAGNSLDFVRAFAGKLPLLGVCLGHQCIGQYFGGKVVRAQKLMHGKTSLISHKGRGLFAGIKAPLRVARYHSLALEPVSLPEDLEVCAESSEGDIMAIAHKKWPLWGVQFHPESCATKEGLQLLKNFLQA